MRFLRYGLYVAILSGFLPLVPADAPGQPHVVLAEDPSQLLKLLPPVPKGWSLIVSQGIGQVTDAPALRTSAVREYRLTSPPQAPGKTVPQQITRITFTDTAYDPDGLFQFNHFAPKPRTEPISGGPPAFYMLEDSPAIEVLTAEKRIVIVSISRRFCLVMELTRQDEAARDFWIQQINLPQLKQAAAHAPEAPLPSHKLKVDFVDELNPKNNQEAYLPYLTQEEQAEQKQAREQGH